MAQGVHTLTAKVAKGYKQMDGSVGLLNAELKVTKKTIETIQS
jgi:hypothetical protein